MKQPHACEWWTLRVTSLAFCLSLNPVVQPEFGLSTAQVFMILEQWVGTGILYQIFCQE
jgi:hypothetical protein